jgi:hypothetical protein
MIKCIDFEICAGNSDAVCTADVYPLELNTVLSKGILLSDPTMCDRCAYNDKFKDFSYDDWKTYKEEVIVPMLRNKNIDELLA